MTGILLLIVCGLTLLFCGIVFIGAPYVPTKRAQIDAALDLLELREGETLLELGAGDGRVAKAAALRGIRVVGYELNPILVLIAKIMTWKQRDMVAIHWRNYLQARWPSADGIFLFSADRYMKKINKKIIASGMHPRVASFAFQIPGRDECALKEGIYLYDYELALAHEQR